jgi:hypothetical protein
MSGRITFANDRVVSKNRAQQQIKTLSVAGKQKYAPFRDIFIDNSI